MPRYNVSLQRSYKVIVECESADGARRIAEWYLSSSLDESTPQERRANKFSIEEIEMTINEATDSEEL
ncbi:MAG TPA: hypothetical protein VGB73_00970 [Pyrinomonadaceae bacterium]|jgi:hypothetical protein